MSTHTRSRRSRTRPHVIAGEWETRPRNLEGERGSRWRDIYHFVLRAPWWLFFAGTAGVFALVNTCFAVLYMGDPRGIANAHGFWDYFLFSVQTIGSANYTVMMPKSTYANVVVSVEAFFGILNLALVTGVTFARFSRPFARVLFSRVAVITPFDGTPMLMFRVANRRGNQILNAAATVALARDVTTTEGIMMRRFEELKLVRARTPLFSLSWTVMHAVDKASPLHGATPESLRKMGAELIVLLSGTDDALAAVIYARHSYMPEEILWNRRFADVLAVSPAGRWTLNLDQFHETEAISA